MNQGPFLVLLHLTKKLLQVDQSFRSGESKFDSTVRYGKEARKI